MRVDLGVPPENQGLGVFIVALDVVLYERPQQLHLRQQVHRIRVGLKLLDELFDARPVYLGVAAVLYRRLSTMQVASSFTGMVSSKARFMLA